MPCEINSILKLTPAQGYPDSLKDGEFHQVQKSGYRIFPVDVPLQLVDENWVAHADIVIQQLIWEQGNTTLKFVILRVYPTAFRLK